MSINSPKVSVVISACHQIQHLSQTINSVLQQTYADFEILLFSNCCLSELKSLDLPPDKRLKLVFSGNLHTFEIFNLGITEAQGKYITFIRIQDLWHPDKLNKQVFCLDHYPNVSLVHSWAVLINHHQKSSGKICQHNLSGWVEKEILKRNQINFSSVILRRHCLDTVGLFNPQLQTIQDWDMWIRLSRRYQFMAIAEPLVFCQQHQDNIKEHWLTIETNLQTTIEQAYAYAPAKLLALKRLSYAYASLYLARQVLANQESDPVIAHHYCRQALEHDPNISFAPDFWQVSLAVMMLHYSKSDRYHRLRLFMQTTQLRVTAIIKGFKVFSNSLLNWVLEEDDTIIFEENREIKRQGKD